MFGTQEIEAIAVVIAALTLAYGVYDARRTHKQTLSQRYLEIILSISESFRTRWEASWEQTLEELRVDHRGEGLNELPVENARQVRHMLNWVDWLGALRSSGALEDLSILTGSIGIPLRRIINAGRPLIESDIKSHGIEYWSNLILIAQELGMNLTSKVESARDSHAAADLSPGS